MSFAELLREFKIRDGRSAMKIAVEANVSSSGLIRYLEGNRTHPPRDVVEALARAMKLDSFDTNCLLVSAGYAPMKEWNFHYQGVFNNHVFISNKHRQTQLVN